MPALDDINRAFREFIRFTGDGLPGEPTNAPLPVGDPSSGVHSPKKADIRGAFGSLVAETEAAVTDANTAADRAEDARDVAVAAAGANLVNIGSRATAVAANIPPEVAYVITAGYAAVGDGGGALYKRVGTQPTHAGKFQSADGAWWEIEEPILNSVQVGGIANLAPVAYAIGARVLVRNGEVAKLPCNPSTGDDLVAMAKWQTGDHLVEQGGTFYIEIADGLHTVSGHIAFQRGRLDIRATGAADVYTISSASIALTSGNIYNTRVVPGFVVGGQNCKGVTGTARGIECLNGAHKVTSLSTITLPNDRFSVSVQVFGVTPSGTSTAELDNTLTMGLDANKIVVPKCTITVDGTGWNGTSEDQEGWLNVNGPEAFAYLENIGIAFTGATGEHDILFHRGGTIKMYRCFVAGAGDKVLRGAYGGRIEASYSFFGGSTTGQQLWQGLAGADLHLVRCCLGSVSGIGISVTASSRAWLTQCHLTGCVDGVRPTYPSAMVDLSVCTISQCTDALQVDRGAIHIATDSLVCLCTNPFTVAGVGYIYGDFTRADNTNSPGAANTYINGGGWYQTNAKLV
jgi:hypothetical protein